MTGAACAFCGRDPAYGFAILNDQRYCHGDWNYPTCYMVASWEDAGALHMLRPELEPPFSSSSSGKKKTS